MGKLVIESLQKRVKIRKLAKAVYKVTGQTAKLKAELVFEDADAMRELNRNSRNVDSVTDVLSFPMFDMANEALPDDEIIPLGDIVICADKAREQAAELEHSFDREVAFLCIHSMLHLLGYDHELSEADELIMIEKQKKIIGRFE